MLARNNGMTDLPKLSLAELNSMGFNRHAFAQMNVENMTQEDLHQVVLLGLADDGVDALAQTSHAETLSQLESAAGAKGFWDFLNKAGKWIGGLFGGKKAQVASNAYVQTLARSNGVTNLPRLSLAELESMGFNKDAFAQMQADNMTADDLKQVILLGLAKDNMDI